MSGRLTTDSQPLQETAQPKVYEARLRVRYAETDQMGVVYHSNFIIWFEVGRVEMMRELGFTYSEMEQQEGTRLAVAEVRCRYKAPAHYDDLIVIRTRLLNVRDSLLHFAYEVLRDEDGAVLAEGETVHMVLDSGFNRARLSSRYLPSFLKAAGRS